ncbi:MAG TPA: TIGR04255 family protein [Gemmatimonadaceae bacterium]
MTASRSFDHLPRAPITEAVLDVRVRARPDIAASDFAAVHGLISLDYPKSETRRQVTAHISFGEQPSGSSSSSLNGFFFRSADGLDVVQFRIDGFSINRLRPYQGWEAWFPRFERLWPIYLDVAQPLAVTRVAARCINQIPGGESGTLEDIFTASIGLPDGIPTNLKTFRNTVTVSDDGDPPKSLNIGQAMQLAPDGRTIQFLLDIDAFTVGEFEPSSVVELFGPLHELRNTAFFQSLTTKVLEGFR